MKTATLSSENMGENGSICERLVEYSPGREIVVNREAYVIGGLSFFNPPNLIHQARRVRKPIGIRVTDVVQPSLEKSMRMGFKGNRRKT